MMSSLPPRNVLPTSFQRAVFALFLLLALLSANVSAQSGDAPLPGVARAVAAAYRAFSDELEARRAITMQMSSFLGDGQLVIRNFSLEITEEETRYQTSFTFRGTPATRPAISGHLMFFSGCVYHVDKRDFRILEARRTPYGGLPDGLSGEQTRFICSTSRK
jgi:hypothetical protein